MYYNIIVLTNSCTPFPYHKSTFPLGAIVTSFDQILFINQKNDSTKIILEIILLKSSGFDINERTMIETHIYTCINLFSTISLFGIDGKPIPTTIPKIK